VSKNSFEIADIIEQFGSEFVAKHKPNSWTLRTLNALRICRTAALGGHEELCDSCAKTRFSYNSCRNRHCPKCQSSKQAAWVEDVSNRIIDTKYFHLVFTVPQELNSICLLNSSGFYNALFSSVWQTLRSFGYSDYGTEIGALAILHTWGQNLSLHPHIHCLIPTAGITLAGNIKRISKKGKYLFPVRKLSVDFRSNMMRAIKKQLIDTNLLIQNKAIINNAWSKNWVVHSQPSFSNAEHVIGYLGLYTHRVAISNHRIVDVSKQSVSFLYKDYRDQNKIKTTKSNGTEFLRRFAMHILDKGFVKVRYFGALSNRYSKDIAMYRKTSTKPTNESSQERIKRLTGFDVSKCPYCNKGKMVIKEVIPRVRSPDIFIRHRINVIKY